MPCVLCNHSSFSDYRFVDLEYTADLYLKLKKYLRLVKTQVRGVMPSRSGERPGAHKRAPLHYCERKPSGGYEYVVVIWDPSGSGEEITFKQFCEVYGLIPVLEYGGE